jgi:hypothetical protein
VTTGFESWSIRLPGGTLRKMARIGRAMKAKVSAIAVK